MSDPAASLRSPEEIFDGDKLPDDLKWIITHFGLVKNDPIVVLFAWHWHRVHQNQEVIDGGALQFKALLDPRIAKIERYAQTIEKIQPGLDKVVQLLSRDEATLKGKLQEGLQRPVDQTIEALQKVVSDLQQTKNQLSWEKYLAVYLGGLASGALLIVCALVR
jgi:hypothetical protein